MRPRVSLLALLGASVACNSAVLTGEPSPLIPPRLPPPVTVAVEPFFDSSQWKTETQLQEVTVLPPPGMSVGMGAGYPGYYGSPYGSYGAYPTDVTVSTTVSVKSVFNRVDVLAAEQAQVIAAVAQMRPAWTVRSTGSLQTLSGPVHLVRVVVGESTVVSSDRTYKTVAFGFGIIIWPLLLLQIGGIDETQVVYGLMDLYTADSSQLRSRLLRYPTQPDFAVDTRGLPTVPQPFGLEVSYNEGVASSSQAHDATLIKGFVQRLSVAIVALVEGVPAGTPPSTPPR
ncbi:MAG TPA: hypothetical protein VEJ89_15565 [Myxococcaceae bacterium]|jgi:hypothetical protein|nr:hypothetical protein [Myxococcaceae bacterium]